MAEDPLDPELIRTLENLAEKFGFKLVDRVSKEALTLRRSPPQSNRQQVEAAFLSAINRFGMVAKFEWTETNYQRLSIFLFTPAEYELHLRSADRRDLASIMVHGTIGATIGGKTRVYPNPDQEEVYVTLEGEKLEYIECDATELPDGVHLYFGFPVLVDRIKRLIVGPMRQE